MLDPFESSPALRLGDAKAKPRETGIVPNAEIVAIEPPKTDTAIPRPPSLAPEFGDAFGAAFSKPRDRLVPAKPAEEERRAYTFDDATLSFHGRDLSLGIDRSEIETISPETWAAALGNVAQETRLLGSAKEGYGPGPLTATQKAGLDTQWDAIGLGKMFEKAMELRGAKADDVVITGVVRKSVGDGAMWYEPRGFVEIRPEVLSEAEFKRREPPLDYQYVDGMLYSDFLIERLGWTPDRPPIDHGDTSPAALLHNHAALVAKKDAEK